MYCMMGCFCFVCFVFVLVLREAHLFSMDLWWCPINLVFLVPLPFSLCMESASYVLSFRMMFFYSVTTDWIFYISLCDNSIDQSNNQPFFAECTVICSSLCSQLAASVIFLLFLYPCVPPPPASSFLQFIFFSAFFQLFPPLSVFFYFFFDLAFSIFFLFFIYSSLTPPVPSRLFFCVYENMQKLRLIMTKGVRGSLGLYNLVLSMCQR